MYVCLAMAAQHTFLLTVILPHDLFPIIIFIKLNNNKADHIRKRKSPTPLNNLTLFSSEVERVRTTQKYHKGLKSSVVKLIII